MRHEVILKPCSITILYDMHMGKGEKGPSALFLLEVYLLRYGTVGSRMDCGRNFCVDFCS